MLKRKTLKAPDSSLENETRFFFKGKELQLHIQRTLCKPAIKILDNTLLINLYVRASEPPLRGLLHQWYLQEARHFLSARTLFWAQKMKVSFHKITIKDQVSRWGSCSSLKNLNYNWRIIMAPEEIVDYLVIHEVAHLTHMNHSADFWQLVAQYDQAYRMHRNWLKEHGAQLFHILPKTTY